MPVVLYGCETWSLTLREECKLRVLENRVLKRISGPKRDEVTGEWRRLHKGALCSELLTKYHYSDDQVKKTKMDKTSSTDGGEKRCIQDFSGKT